MSGRLYTLQLGLQFVKAQKRADGNGHTQIPAPKTARHTLRSLRALRELTRAEFAALPKVTPACTTDIHLHFPMRAPPWYSSSVFGLVRCDFLR